MKAKTEKRRGVENVRMFGKDVLLECETDFSRLQLLADPEKLTMFSSSVNNSDFTSFKVIRVGDDVVNLKIGDYVQVNEILRSHWVNIPDNQDSVEAVCKKVKNNNDENCRVIIETKVQTDKVGTVVLLDNAKPKMYDVKRYIVVEYLVMHSENILFAWDN